MRSKPKRPFDARKPHLWFAWHPVQVTLYDGTKQWIWLEPVRRAKMPGMTGHWWQYWRMD